MIKIQPLATSMYLQCANWQRRLLGEWMLADACWIVAKASQKGQSVLKPRFSGAAYCPARQGAGQPQRVVEVGPWSETWSWEGPSLECLEMGTHLTTHNFWLMTWVESAVVKTSHFMPALFSDGNSSTNLRFICIFFV